MTKVAPSDSSLDIIRRGRKTILMPVAKLERWVNPSSHARRARQAVAARMTEEEREAKGSSLGKSVS